MCLSSVAAAAPPLQSIDRSGPDRVPAVATTLQHIGNGVSAVFDPFAPGRLLRNAKSLLTLAMGLLAVGNSRAQPARTGGGYRTQADWLIVFDYLPEIQRCALRETGPVAADRVAAYCLARAAATACGEQGTACLTTLQRSIPTPREAVLPDTPWSERGAGIRQDISRAARSSMAWQEAWEEFPWLLDQALWGNLPKPGARYSVSGLRSIIALMDDPERDDVTAGLADISLRCGDLMRAEVERLFQLQPERLDRQGRQLLLEWMDARFSRQAGRALTRHQYSHILKDAVLYLNARPAD